MSLQDVFICRYVQYMGGTGDPTLVYFTFPDHPLLDIRSRSLRSVSFKLSTGLLHIADMVHERDFLSHLLEWFNFEEVVMEAQALSLISQVAEVRTMHSLVHLTPHLQPDRSIAMSGE